MSRGQAAQAKLSANIFPRRSVKEDGRGAGRLLIIKQNEQKGARAMSRLVEIHQ
jgi:hypothetical protein